VVLFCPCQKRFPTLRVLVCEAPEILLYTSVDHFSLFVGLRVVDRASLQCCSLRLSHQNKLRKMGSRSLIMERGRPWIFITPATSTSITFLVEYGCPKAKKWPYLVNRSTTTKMEFFPADIGNPSIESRLISSHTWVVTGNDWRRLAGDVASPLFR